MNYGCVKCGRIFDSEIECYNHELVCRGVRVYTLRLSEGSGGVVMEKRRVPDLKTAMSAVVPMAVVRADLGQWEVRCLREDVHVAADMLIGHVKKVLEAKAEEIRQRLLGLDTVAADCRAHLTKILAEENDPGCRLPWMPTAERRRTEGG